MTAARVVILNQKGRGKNGHMLTNLSNTAAATTTTTTTAAVRIM